MLQLPNENNVKDRENVPALTDEQLKRTMQTLDYMLHIEMKQTKCSLSMPKERKEQSVAIIEAMYGDLQQLLYRYSNLEHFWSNAGGWDGVNELRDKANGEWISVDDRLPENGVHVLVYDIIHGQQSIAIGLYDYEEQTWYCKSLDWVHFTVSKWQPLPEPPKGK